jgi:hypothetical protein
MENELSAGGWTSAEDNSVHPVATARIHFAAALILGIWYSIVFASAMTMGVKYLHPDTPDAHGLLHSLAWAVGSGMAVALASLLTRTRPLVVGICSSAGTSLLWVTLFILLRVDFDQASGEAVFGYSISLRQLVFGISLLVFLAGVAGSVFASSLRDDEEVTAGLAQMPSRHWLWIWLGGAAWVSMLPLVLYYVWLQFATAFYSIFHPSLWFQDGSDLFFGFLGIVALGWGIGVSLRAVSDKGSYGGVVWKRVLVFLGGTLILASVVSPFFLNLDIDRMKDMPASLGSHPWWIL